MTTPDDEGEPPLSSVRSMERSEDDDLKDEEESDDGMPGLMKKSTRDTMVMDPEEDYDYEDDDDDEEEEEEIRRRQELEPYLLNHAYHLPGNTYWLQDWWQYMTNNHPLFGICFHHPYHPLSGKIRAISLIGSMLFGLALTNIIYLAFVFTEQDDAFDASFYEFETNLTKTGLSSELDQTISSVSVTTGNLVLWTVGALLHGLYDNTIWSLAACAFCKLPDNPRLSVKQRDQRLQCGRNTGAVFVVLSVILVTAIASFAVLLRAAIEADEEEETQIFSFFQNATNTSTTNGTTTTLIFQQQSSSSMDEEGPNIFESHTVVQSQLQEVYYSPQDFADYKFVVSYFVELVLSYLIYYPIAGTILFSGVLSCGKWQVTGGRPYELQQLALQQQQIMEEEDDEGVEVEWESKRSGTGNNNSSDDQEEYTNGVESCSSGQEEEHSDSPPSDEEEGHGSIHHHPEEDQREQDVLGVEISKDGV